MSRVLVVDDDPNLRHLVSVRLQKAGHRVIAADSAAEALAVVQDRGAPDVVVLDVTMPGMTGLELLPIMRTLDGCASLPAIFLSGRVDHADVEAGRALGATYLTKPFSAVALVNAVERLAPVEAGW
jgi:CheY-like chemotaxis protein